MPPDAYYGVGGERENKIPDDGDETGLEGTIVVRDHFMGQPGPGTYLRPKCFKFVSLLCKFTLLLIRCTLSGMASQKLISGSEVAKHNSRESCWIIVHGGYRHISRREPPVY